MKVKHTPRTSMPWHKKSFPRIVALDRINPATFFLALSLKNSDEFYGINLSSLKSTYPAKNTEVYKVENFVEYDGIVTLSNE